MTLLASLQLICEESNTLIVLENINVSKNDAIIALIAETLTSAYFASRVKDRVHSLKNIIRLSCPPVPGLLHRHVLEITHTKLKSTGFCFLMFTSALY